MNDPATIVKSIAELVLAVGSLTITRYAWKAAQTTKEGNKEQSDAMNRQLELALRPVDNLVQVITGQVGNVNSLVSALSSLPSSIENLRSEVGEVRRHVSRIRGDS